MNNENLKRFWITLSVILAIILTVIVFIIAFVILHAIAFPHGSIAESPDGVIAVVIISGISGLMILYLFSWTYRLAKKEIIASKTYKDATKHQAFVKVISKLTRGFGNLSLTGSQHLIAFEFSDKVRRTFEVDTMQYSIIIEGDAGLLTYKQNGEHFYFVAFEVL